MAVTKTYRAYKEVLRKDPCVYCGEPSTGLDHIVPESRGGKFGWENRAPACHYCDGAKGNLSLVWFLLAMRLRALGHHPPLEGASKVWRRFPGPSGAHQWPLGKPTRWAVLDLNGVPVFGAKTFKQVNTKAHELNGNSSGYFVPAKREGSGSYVPIDGRSIYPPLIVEETS